VAKILGYGVAGGLLGAVVGGVLMGLWGWYQDSRNPTGWGALFTFLFAVLGMIGGGSLGAVAGGVMAARGKGKGAGRGSAKAKGGEEGHAPHRKTPKAKASAAHALPRTTAHRRRRW